MHTSPPPPQQLADVAAEHGVVPVTRVDRRRSTQHVWYVTGHPRGPATLKWYQYGPRPEEAAALRAFATADLPVPDVFASGNDPHPHLLAAFLPADPMPPRAAARWFPAAMRLAAGVADSDVQLPALTAATDLQVKAALESLHDAGLGVPDPTALYQLGPDGDLLPAHGAFRPANVLPVGGQLHLLGPSGFAASPGRDAGFWVIHACDDPTDLLELDRWVRQAAALSGTAHADVLWWAGVGLLVYAAAGWRREQVGADEVAALIAAARRVLRW